MRFTVTGRSNGTDIQEGRLQPASAIVLAMRWIEKGLGNVRVTDGSGRVYDLEEFRAASNRRKSKFTPF